MYINRLKLKNDPEQKPCHTHTHTHEDHSNYRENHQINPVSGEPTDHVMNREECPNPIDIGRQEERTAAGNCTKLAAAQATLAARTMINECCPPLLWPKSARLIPLRQAVH